MIAPAEGRVGIVEQLVGFGVIRSMSIHQQLRARRPSPPGAGEGEVTSTAGIFIVLQSCWMGESHGGVSASGEKADVLSCGDVVIQFGVAIVETDVCGGSLATVHEIVDVTLASRQEP